MAADPNAITGIAPVAPPVTPAPIPLVQPSVTPDPKASWDPQGAGLAASKRLAAQPTPGYAPVRNQSIPAEGRALLGTIGSRGFESNGSYTQRYNQPDFQDFSQHPNTYGSIKSGPYRGKKSNAAGRYQFISTTYAEQAKKQGLTDFSPESQDKAAWGLAQETYAQKTKGRDLATDLKNPGKLNQIANALHGQWTSLPGGIESSRSNLKTFSQSYSKALKNETARTPGGPQYAAPPAPRRASPLYDNPRSPTEQTAQNDQIPPLPGPDVTGPEWEKQFKAHNDAIDKLLKAEPPAFNPDATPPIRHRPTVGPWRGAAYYT